MRLQRAKVVSVLALGLFACVAEEPPAQEPPASGGGGASMQEPEPGAMGGQTGEGGGSAIACFAVSWHGPDSPRTTAHCQVPWGSWDIIRCTCDTDLCPLDSEGVPDASCAVEPSSWGSGLGCQDMLWETCGVRPYEVGFCDMEGLATDARATCWTQPDGSHLCRCPHQEQLVPSAETNCDFALYSACASDCEDQSGRCEYVPPVGPRTGLSRFRCSCETGIPGTSQAYFCEDALRRHCRPECENERGACWKVPNADSGVVDTADCLCKGSSQFVHLSADDWDPNGEACRSPLAITCGE